MAGSQIRRFPILRIVREFRHGDVAQTKLLTAEEFMAADLGEGNFELVRGEIVEMPRPTPEHGRSCMTSGFALESLADKSGLRISRLSTTRPC